jgi:hypothetical protein
MDTLTSHHIRLLNIADSSHPDYIEMSIVGHICGGCIAGVAVDYLVTVFLLCADK